MCYICLINRQSFGIQTGLFYEIYCITIEKKEERSYTVINWQPYVKGLVQEIREYDWFNLLPPGFVQRGINIASVTTIMVTK